MFFKGIKTFIEFIVIFFPLVYNIGIVVALVYAGGRFRDEKQQT